ncbi:MAG: hypothetical protein OWU33_08205 [Firmicutes bacterium]|nr:hypothetical protein [Bacillota bacterium]
MDRVEHRTPLKVMCSLAALVTVFLPWLDRTVPGPAVPLNAFQLSPVTWAWVALNIIILVGLIRKWQTETPSWLVVAWAFLGAISLGVAASGVVFLHVAALVSQDLAAPTPVALAYGSAIFGVICALWTALGVMSIIRLLPRH